MSEPFDDSGDSNGHAGPARDDGAGDETMADVSVGTLVTRGEAAQILETSKSSIRRLEKKGRLRPAEIAANGTRLFELEQVRHVERQVVRTRTAPPAPTNDEYDGEMARDAFTLFDESVDPVDVVKRTAFDPRAVQALYDKWLSLRGGFFVPADVAAQICALPWYRGSSLAFRGSASTLLKGLEAMRPTEVCLVCEARAAALCEECSREATLREAARRATEARRRQETQQQNEEHERFLKMLENNVRRRASRSP